MSNTPHPNPHPRKGPKSGKKTPIISVTFKVDSILLLGTDIVKIEGHDSGNDGKEHVITLYGKPEVSPNANDASVVGRLANFQIRLVTASIGVSPSQSERVGNIIGYYGSVDTSGRFSL